MRSALSPPPAITSSAPRTATSASTTSAMPLRGTSRDSVTMRMRSARRSSRAPCGVKRSRSTPHGTTFTRPCGRAHAHELEQLRARRRDDAVHGVHDAGLVRKPRVRRRVGAALMAALLDAQRVERVRDRDAERLRRAERGEPAHPEMRVHDVRTVQHPRAPQRACERADVRVDVVLGYRPRRAGVDVLDDDAFRHDDAARQFRIVAPRVDGHAVAQRDERRRERRDVHVLTAGIDAAKRRERARVLGDHRNSHAVTSAKSMFQACKNESRP